MVNKKGWLRILEAFIAVVLIASFLLVLYSRAVERPKISEEVYQIQKTILDEIASNPELRQAVLNGNEEKIINFTYDRIPSGFEFAMRICEVNEVCGLKEYKEGVYSSERIISSTLEEYSPKKLKIFMWKK